MCGLLIATVIISIITIMVIWIIQQKIEQRKINSILNYIEFKCTTDNCTKTKLNKYINILNRERKYKNE